MIFSDTNIFIEDAELFQELSFPREQKIRRKDIKGNLKSLTTCPVCQRYYRNSPLVLCCYHSYCVECEEKMAEGTRVKCPTCGQITYRGALRQDFRIKALMQVLTGTSLLTTSNQ